MSPFWRRRPLHERLLAETGLPGVPVPPEPPFPLRTIGGVHGPPRAQEWDAVVTAESELPGEEVHFVGLADGTLVVEEDVPDGALGPLADAVEGELEPPYSATALRRGDRLWAVGAKRIEVAELTDTAGDEIELAMQAGQRTLTVDGESVFGGIASLERLAGARHDDYVATARRLDGDLFEVGVSPL